MAPDSPNIREILDPDCAALSDAEDQQAFADAVLFLCEDALRRNALGEAARRRLLEKNLTWRSAAERVLAIAREIVPPP